VAKIGLIGSPAIFFNHVFYKEYRRLLECLSSKNEIFFIGNLGKYKPKYINNYKNFNILLRFKGILPKFRNYFYVVKLSNKVSIIQWLRKNIGKIIDIYIAKETIKYFKINKVDLIFALPIYPELYLKYIIYNTSKPLLLQFWEDQIVFLDEYLYSNKLNVNEINKEITEGYKWLRLTCCLARKIIVPTNILKERLINLGISENKINIIPVCSDPFIPIKTGTVKKVHGFNNSQMLFYLGSLSLYHDINTVLKAFKELDPNEAFLVIAGGWRKPKVLDDESSNIVYTGRLSEKELKNYLSSADLCMAIYKFRQSPGFFPASVLRFMFAGKAIIATDLPEIREMFRDTNACLLIPQLDSKALMQSIRILLTNKIFCTKLGNKAKKLAESNYTWTHYSKKMQVIIDKILG